MDEGTMALLDSLERSSPDDHVMRNIEIILRCHDGNYNNWKERMMVKLKSENMTGFVDGSLTDPDPKGETQDPLVSIYSEKWKKLDKQLMKWMRCSFDDVLKYLVQESKTSKDLWDLLRTHFSNDNGIYSNHLARNKDKEYYRKWKFETEEYLQENGVLGYVNGEEKHPDPREESEDENWGSRSEEWKRADKRVMNMIMADLNDTIKYMVREMETSKEMWDTLEMFYTTDYGALFASLEDRYSQGEGVAKTFGIKLINKENYQHWRDQMMEFLYSHKMKGFIDGTFRDPDPKGESEEEHVTTMFSKKWKSDDEQVMDCITYSLNETLHYMVAEMKTSKELWDTLEMFFTNDYPALDDARRDIYGGGEGSQMHFRIEMINKENYQPWRDDMMFIFNSQRMKGFIDGTFRDPDPNGESEEEHVRIMYSNKWKLFDQVIMNYITYSLNDILSYMVIEMKTTKELWDTLELFFTTDAGYLLASPENNYSHPEGVMNIFSIILHDKESYPPWRNQMMEFLYSQRMKGFIDGTFRDPEPKEESEEEHVTTLSEK